MFSLKKIILIFLIFLFYYTTFGKGKDEEQLQEDPSKNKDLTTKTNGNDYNTTKPSGTETTKKGDNGTSTNPPPSSTNNKNEIPKENLIKQRLNNYTNIVNLEPGTGFEYNDYKIYSPELFPKDFSYLNISFTSDPRINGGNIPLAFRFCPPNKLSNKERKCNDGFGYMVCYVSQLDPKRSGSISLKYTVENTNQLIKQCNEINYKNWTEAGPKHGLLMTYLPGGLFQLSLSYSEKKYNYSVGEGNCLLLRLFENDSFLTGVYSTGLNVSNQPIYPNNNEYLTNDEFIKFANGLLLEDTKFIGPYILGADIFLRYKNPLILMTKSIGNEECIPKFSYLYSNYYLESKYLNPHPPPMKPDNETILVKFNGSVSHPGRNLIIFGVPELNKFEINHNLNTTLSECSDGSIKSQENEDCNSNCNKTHSPLNSFKFNYSVDPNCEILISRTKNCSCLSLNGTFKSYVNKDQNQLVKLSFDGRKLTHGNNSFELQQNCTIKNIPVTNFKGHDGFNQSFVLKLNYKHLNSKCETIHFPFKYPNTITQIISKDDLLTDLENKPAADGKKTMKV